MNMTQLNKVEKKVLGALLILADEHNTVEASIAVIAKRMGYKRGGGIISYALQALEMKDYIIKQEPGKYLIIL